MKPSASHYTGDQVKACEAVILELNRILGEYWANIVIVGGWVPTLLANNEDNPHKGTLDVDIALNHLLIPEESYEKIHALLVKHGYEQNTARKAVQFQYFRKITLEKEYTVTVDLLTGQYDVETGKKRRHEPIQDVMALKARGVDLVFERFETVVITGELPNKGGQHSAECKVASASPVIVMKCSAMAGRYEDKDPYDLYYFIRYYRGKGVPAILEAIKPDLHHGLMKEAVERMRKFFKSPDESGPSQVARFLEVQDDEEQAATIRQEVYQTINELLEGIDKINAEGTKS
jgi:hypothetical protein